MTNLPGLSRLPQDDSYWQDLERRIMAELGPSVREAAGVGAPWWVPLAARASSLGALAVAAGLVALLLLPPRAAEPLAAPAGLLRLPEDDPALVALLAGSPPPTLASVLIPQPDAAEP